MAGDQSLKILLGVEDDAAKSQLRQFYTLFKQEMTALGATKADISAFATMVRDIESGKVALKDFDQGTQQLIQTFRANRDVAAARDFLGLPAHEKVREEIVRTRAAYETLAASGKLSGAELAQAALKTDEKIRTLTSSTNGWKESLGKIQGELAVAGAALYGLGHGLGGAATASMDFGKKMAEVSTLISDTSSMDAMSESVRAMSREYGGDAKANAQALYQLISAGATAGADAIGQLDQANKLAMGGVTDVAVAADGLSSAMNAYRGKVGDAKEVSDGFFTAVKSGKTTVAELSNSIGNVAPVAASAGVSLDELLAGVATLTSSGLKTSESVSGLKAAISNIIKPSTEASAAAAQMGLQFDAQSLASKGLSGFLSDVGRATGGNVEKMGQLFGSVDGLNAVLALTGTGAGKFAATLEDMANKAGATDEAVAKMLDTPAARSARFQAAFHDVQISIGDAVTAFSPLLEAVTKSLNAFNELGSGTKALIAGTVALGAAAIPVSLAWNALSSALGILRNAALMAAEASAVQGGAAAAAAAASTAAAAQTTAAAGLMESGWGRVKSAGAGVGTFFRALPGMMQIALVVAAFEAAAVAGKWLGETLAKLSLDADGTTQRLAAQRQALIEQAAAYGNTANELSAYRDTTVAASAAVQRMGEAERARYSDDLKHSQAYWQALYQEQSALMEVGKGSQAAKDEAGKHLEAIRKGLADVSAAAAMSREATANLIDLRAMDLISQFGAQLDEAKKKGEDLGAATTAALADMAKALDTQSLPSIRAYGQTLDELGQRGKLSALQIKDAWAGALDKLNGADLQKFAITAEAAFDGSARGARVLTQVMDGVLRQAIAASGQDFGLLTAGLSQATTNSLAELDLIVNGMGRLKSMGVDTGAAINGAIVNALKNASTAQDLSMIEAAMSRLGKTGSAAGVQIGEAMKAAKEKVDALYETAMKKVNDLREKAANTRTDAAHKSEDKQLAELEKTDPNAADARRQQIAQEALGQAEFAQAHATEANATGDSKGAEKYTRDAEAQIKRAEQLAGAVKDAALQQELLNQVAEKTAQHQESQAAAEETRARRIKDENERKPGGKRIDQGGDDQAVRDQFAKDNPKIAARNESLPEGASSAPEAAGAAAKEGAVITINLVYGDKTAPVSVPSGGEDAVVDLFARLKHDMGRAG